MPDQTTEKYLSVSEVAEMLGVSPRSVQLYAKAGEFPNCWRAGSGKRAPYIIPYADVKAFLEKREK